MGFVEINVLDRLTRIERATEKKREEERGEIRDRPNPVRKISDSDAEPCKYFSCGSEVSSSSRPEVRGTLGGFVFHTHLQSTSVCAITTNHVMRTMVSEDDTMIVDGARIGKLLEIVQFVDVGIAAMEIFGEFVPKCQLAFKDTNGDAKPCNLYDTKTEDIEEWNGRHVHIWGASSKPGKGIIACSKYTTTSNAYFLVNDLPGQDEPFSKPGDGGAIVISESIDGSNMTAIGIVLGKSVGSSKEGSYVCSFLQVSLDRLSKYNEGTFSIYKGVVKF
ncbi:uncharacterized protein LOC128240287 isoform X2 [Mya arenaria]|uniref:uncharacterized protein LOC128240287 isoform X2 n=1 Tax=Mya arenaria TaxID=6604 RepID=UPI0022E57F38|nr:uncharacterized protein LOC128240287 isoform X2 [Mya arenaria]